MTHGDELTPDQLDEPVAVCASCSASGATEHSCDDPAACPCDGAHLDGGDDGGA